MKVTGTERTRAIRGIKGIRIKKIMIRTRQLRLKDIKMSVKNIDNAEVDSGSGAK